MEKFLFSSKNIIKDGYIYNTIANLLYAFQSIFFLIVINHILEIDKSGIFSLAFASGNLFMNIGKYGVRNYQVSDTNKEYQLKDYCCARIFSGAVMIAGFAVYLIYSAVVFHYSAEKTGVILCFFIYRGIDVFEDIFQGEYQKRNRMDLVGKTLIIRLVVSMISFGVFLVLTKNLLTASVGMVVISFAAAVRVLFLSNKGLQIRAFGVYTSENYKKAFRLLRVCFPLCLGNFLLIYICNASKYAIDAYLNDTAQAYFGFIFMPVFFVNMVGGFLYVPMQTQMSEWWNEGDMKAFRREVKMQGLYIVGITIFCMLCAFLAGIPVLSRTYGTDLTGYRTELLILLFGSGFYALALFLMAVITIIRCQKSMTVVYLVISAVVYFVTPPVVKTYGMSGAVFAYAVSMLMLFIGFWLCYFFGYKNKQTGVSR